MDDRMRSDLTASRKAGRYRLEPLHRKRGLYVGVDIGSISSDIVVLNEAGGIVFCDYQLREASALVTRAIPR
ncbi:hypothetical protein ES708_29259 [subsurface metagenome]